MIKGVVRMVETAVLVCGGYLDWQAQSVGCVHQQLLSLPEHVLDVLLAPLLHAGSHPLLVRHKLQLLAAGAEAQQVIALPSNDVEPAAMMLPPFASIPRDYNQDAARKNVWSRHMGSGLVSSSAAGPSSDVEPAATVVPAFASWPCILSHFHQMQQRSSVFWDVGHPEGYINSTM